MDRYESLCPLVYGKLKSERRRKRLRKKGTEKKLLVWHREEQKLYSEKWQQELVLLDSPIRKGWKRHFILRDDLRNRPDAPFFEALLEKINTVEYSRNKKFRMQKRRMKKYRYVLHTQKLKYITEYHYHHLTRCPLSKEEKEYFIPEYGYGSKTLYVKHYVFNQPWRYVLSVKPHWITHARELDEVREKRLGEIKHHLETNHLRHKITKLTEGWEKYRYIREGTKNREYAALYHNKPFTQFLEMYEDEKQMQAEMAQ